MYQPIYYSDDEVQVTGESLIINNREYSLAHVTRASIHRQGATMPMNRGTVFALLYFLWFILRLLLRAIPNPFIVLGAAIGFGALARQVQVQMKEKPRPQYIYAIELHGPSETVEVLTSQDSIYLKNIVAVINHAVGGGMTEGRREALREEKRRRRHRGSGGRSSPSHRHEGTRH